MFLQKKKFKSWQQMLKYEAKIRVTILLFELNWEKDFFLTNKNKPEWVDTKAHW